MLNKISSAAALLAPLLLLHCVSWGSVEKTYSRGNIQGPSYAAGGCQSHTATPCGFTGWSNYGAGKTTIEKTLKASPTEQANGHSLEIILEEGDGPNELWKLLNAIATVLTGTAVPLYNRSVHYVRFRTYLNNRVSGECVYRLKNHEFMTVYALPLMLFARSAKTQRLLFKEAAGLFKLGCRGDRS